MIKPLLIDLDGVLRIGNNTAPYLKEFFHYLKISGRPSVILSNTTRTHAESVKYFFRENMFECPVRILTAADATNYYVREHYKSAAVFCADEVIDLFSDMLDFQNPEVVVMGDKGKDWDYTQLNSIFKFVKNGAKLVTMQKNRFWTTPEEGLLLDLGPFVTAIEYAAGVEATVIGKPSQHYFSTALKVAGAKNHNGFLMLGDDLENDIQGAVNAGGKGIVILTGKTSKEDIDKLPSPPGFVVKDLLAAVELLEKLP